MALGPTMTGDAVVPDQKVDLLDKVVPEQRSGRVIVAV